MAFVHARAKHKLKLPCMNTAADRPSKLTNEVARTSGKNHLNCTRKAHNFCSAGAPLGLVGGVPECTSIDAVLDAREHCLDEMCVRIAMAGWLHGVLVGDWLFIFPLCGFSLSLFCNYFLMKSDAYDKCSAVGLDVRHDLCSKPCCWRGS